MFLHKELIICAAWYIHKSLEHIYLFKFSQFIFFNKLIRPTNWPVAYTVHTTVWFINAQLEKNVIERKERSAEPFWLKSPENYRLPGAIFSECVKQALLIRAQTQLPTKSWRPGTWIIFFVFKGLSECRALYVKLANWIRQKYKASVWSGGGFA